MKRVFFVAGEASGDLHGAGLVRSLRELQPSWEFVGLGGAEMAAAGVQLRANLVERSVMGIRKVAAEMGFILDVAGHVLEELRTHPPDLVVLIDYPGLNLNIARMAQRCGVPVVYYICPQVWAWAPWRMKRIAARADLLLVVLPFEEKLYREVHPRVSYVGNPVFEHLTQREAEPLETSLVEAGAGGGKVLALFPGSRSQEVEEALPIMLRIAQQLRLKFPELQVHVSCHRERLRPIIDRQVASSEADVRIYDGPGFQLQRAAHLSLVVSGTATLEQAFFGVPQVVLYPVTRWERWLFGLLSVTPFIALANLFAGRAVVPEFLVTPGGEAGVLAAATALVEGPARVQCLEELASLRKQRFQPGGSREAARQLVAFLDEKSSGEAPKSAPAPGG